MRYMTYFGDRLKVGNLVAHAKNDIVALHHITKGRQGILRYFGDELLFF